MFDLINNLNNKNHSLSKNKSTNSIDYNILKCYNENELTLSVEGRINSVTSKELDEEINNELGNFNSLILDFTDLEYISSAGLKVLIATQRKLKPDNIPFIIKNSNDVIMEVFLLSGVDRVLEIE